MRNLRVGPLVRAISSDEVAIWTEWSHRCEVTLTATPTGHQQGQEPGTFSVRSQTVRIGGRYYALSRLTGLQPATWYNYQVSDLGQERGLSSPAEGTITQCFRTFDPPDAGSVLRLAYGSCRKLSAVEPDALSALGPWLLRFLDQRESLWPRLLLLIGDQIYADDRVGRHEQAHSPAQHAHASQIVAAQPFEEFARMYEEAWAGDEGIRQVLAILPTYMIFDGGDCRPAGMSRLATLRGDPREIKAAGGNAMLDLLLVDLADQQSVRRIVIEFQQRYDHLDVLINNAAVFKQKRILTVDSLETMFATNHLGPFLLTNLLLASLKASISSRILTITAPSTTRVDFEDLQGEKEFHALQAFGASKTCNLLFTYELARRLAGTGLCPMLCILAW